MAEETSKKSNKGLIACIVAAVAVCLVVVLMIILGGNKIVGKYKLAAFISEDGTESTEMVDLMSAFGGSYTIEFKSDKTGVLEVSGGDSSESMNFTYNDKKIIVEEDGETEETDYTFEKDTVTINLDGQGMKFTRE